MARRATRRWGTLWDGGGHEGSWVYLYIGSTAGSDRSTRLCCQLSAQMNTTKKGRSARKAALGLAMVRLTDDRRRGARLSCVRGAPGQGDSWFRRVEVCDGRIR